MIIPVPFGPDSGPARSTNASAGGLVNCFVEAAPDAKVAYTVYGCPGLKAFSNTGSSFGCRGWIRPDDSTLYVIFGENVYKITAGGAATSVGIVTGTDNASLAFNRNSTATEIAICANGKKYILQSDVITEIADADLPANPIDVVYLDGRFVWFYSDGVMYQSALNNGTSYAALEFAEAEAKPDGTRAGGIVGDRLVNFGRESIEFFYNAAPDEGFVFSPQPGSLIERGILAKDCWTTFDNTVAWIDQDGFVVRGEANFGRVIGTYPVHKDIQTTISKQEQTEIVVSTWSFAGHEMLQIWASGWCWVYDASSQKWFRRTSQDRDSWRGNFLFRAYNRTLVGDAYTGILYEHDSDTYDENGKSIIRECVSKYVHDGPNRLRHNALFVDMETGVGDAEDSDSEDVTPEIMVDWSDNGGHAFEGYRTASVGAQGKYSTEIKLTRLGASSRRGRVYRIRYSAARPFVLIAAQADVTRLKN